MPRAAEGAPVANVGLRGRVVDEEGRPLPNLVVDARDRDVFVDDDLGETRTDEEGRYSLAYAPEAYRGWADPHPDLVVRVHDAAGIRLLAESGTFRQTRETVLDLPDLVVARREATGWLVTNGTARVRRLTEGNHVELLVDGERVFDAVVDMVDAAKRDVWLLQLLFEPDFIAAFPAGEVEGRRRLVDALRDACARGADTRVMLNENAVLPDHVDDIEEAFRDACSPGHAIHVKRFPMSPAVMHAKLLVRDCEEALLIGPPFEQRFWDTSAHRFDEPRRGKSMPVHDLAARIRGPAVADLASVFVELWNARPEDGGDRLVPPAPPPPQDAVTLQTAVTLPAGVWSRDGERGILEAYERALAAAESYAYLETQYFTSKAAARAIRRALRANPRLEVILVLNESMDIPLYNQWQRTRLEEIGWPKHPRFRAYSPWQAGARDGQASLRTVYVHSKVALVDDHWVTAGTANLDGISLEGAREFGLRGARSVDVNVVLLDGIEGAPANGLAARARMRLWSEMLGLPEGALRERPPNGWRELWDGAAARNLASLQRSGTMDAGLVLPHGVEVPRDVRVVNRGMSPFTL